MLNGCQWDYELIGAVGGLGGVMPGVGGSSGTGAEGSGAFGGAGTGGAGQVGEAGSGNTGGLPALEFVVSTDQDEQDPGATEDDPLGTGLSLREAILLANAEPGHQTISFDGGLYIVLEASSLPSITETADLVGPIEIDGADLPPFTPCVLIDGSDVRVSSITVHNCPSEPILMGGARNEVSDCTVTAATNSIAVDGQDHLVQRNEVQGSLGAGIWVGGSGARILDNRITDAEGVGIELTDEASSAIIVGNVVWGGNVAIGVHAPPDITVAHNTTFEAVVGAIVDGAASVDLRNNIFAGSAAAGVELRSGELADFDNNLFFGNAGGDCVGCSPGPASIFADPLFTDSSSGDLSLASGSPAIDVGVDLGYDRNQSGTGLFDGSAPDLGAVESE